MEFEIEKVSAPDSGELVIDLPIINLVNDKDLSAPSYTGPGCLIKNAEGELDVKCYCRGSTRHEDLRISNIKPGKLIADDQYYQLSATDFYGKQWVSERLLLDMDSGVPSGHLVVRAKIRRLSNTRSLTIDAGSPFLKLDINKSIKIPGNKLAETEIKVDGEQKYSSVSFNAAGFHSGDFLFSVNYLNDEDRPTITAASSYLRNDSILAISSQICEALSFVFGEDINWTKCEFSSGNNLTTVVNIPLTTGGKKQNPPISGYMKSHAQAVWELFDCYFRYIYDEEREYRHQISSYVYRSLSAAGSTIEIKSLVLAVSIEGILKTEFDALGNPNESQREEIRKVISNINSMSLSEVIRKRALGVIENLTRVRAQDKLMILIQRGLVPKEEVTAWKALRNSSAHADSVSASNFQDHLDKYHKVTTLFNRLIFLCVGYIGEFTNYGETQGNSWRIDRYRKLQ